VALIALPGASLPDPALAIWVPFALLGPLFYAAEGNVVARWGTFGLDPVQVMFWASLIAAIIILPVAVLSGQMFFLAPFGRPEAALVFNSGLHALLYAGYVWLNGKAGAVFASQVAYFVTGSGVFWAMLLLGERFSTLVWVALVVMLAGVALVQPNERAKAVVA
jgi:drug/metabolite transporter (DMT)-like permease